MISPEKQKALIALSFIKEFLIKTQIETETQEYKMQIAFSFLESLEAQLNESTESGT